MYTMNFRIYQDDITQLNSCYFVYFSHLVSQVKLPGSCYWDLNSEVLGGWSQHQLHWWSNGHSSVRRRMWNTDQVWAKVLGIPTKSIGGEDLHLCLTLHQNSQIFIWSSTLSFKDVAWPWMTWFFYRKNNNMSSAIESYRLSAFPELG